MLDWKNYRLKLKNRIGAFGKLQPKTLQGYQSLNQAGEDSPLDLKRPVVPAKRLPGHWASPWR